MQSLKCSWTLFTCSCAGVLLAILESLGYILPMVDETGKRVVLPPGAVSAGYQNFFICIEMFFAAVALRYAFPIDVYVGEGADGVGRSVTMQSISSSLKVRAEVTFLIGEGLTVLQWKLYFCRRQ